MLKKCMMSNRCMPDLGSAQRQPGPVQTNNKIIWPPGLTDCDQVTMMACRADVRESRSNVRARMSVEERACNPSALNVDFGSVEGRLVLCLSVK